MDKGISNTEIKKIFNNEQIQDLRKKHGCFFNGLIYKLY